MSYKFVVKQLSDSVLSIIFTATDSNYTGDIRNAYKISVGKPEGYNHSEDLAVDGRIILERFLGK
jgi:hypothetical protein